MNGGGGISASPDLIFMPPQVYSMRDFEFGKRSGSAEDVQASVIASEAKQSHPDCFGPLRCPRNERYRAKPLAACARS
jgi:hypothetical protein